jgi:hypothetical protein
MTIRASKFTDGTLPVVTGDCAGDVISQDFYFDVTAAQIVLNDIIDIGVLPAYHTISDAILIADDLDTNASPLIALDVGLMSGVVGDTTNTRTCSAVIFAADIGARSAAISRPTLKTAFNIIPTEADRSIGVKFQAAAATAAAGRIRLRVFMHPADHKLQF